MKTLLLIALLSTCCFASFVDNGLSFAKKDVFATQTCNSYTPQCASTGGSCSNGCPNCYNAVQSCYANAQNATAYCNCATNYVNCLAAAQDYTCDSNAAYKICVSGNANCTCGTPYTGAVSYKTCSTNAYCDDNTAKCMLLKGSGSACNSSNECGDSNSSPLYQYNYYCQKNVCTKSGNAPGEPCNSNSDCDAYSSYSLGCVSGTCASQKVGSTCPSSGYCGPNLYCDDSSTCQKTEAIGATCNGNAASADTMCGQTGECDGKSNTCVGYNTKSKGQSCTFQGECLAGLYCSLNTSTCQTDLQPIACSTDADCKRSNPDYESCDCDMNGKATCSPPLTDTGCVNQYITFLQCCQDNSCQSRDIIPGGCVQNHCKNSYECYAACYVSYYKSQYGSDAVCFSNYDNTCSDASQTFVAWALVAIVSVIAIMI